MAAVNKSNQEEWGEKQEHGIFILVHPSSRATSSPLQTSKDFH